MKWTFIILWYALALWWISISVDWYEYMAIMLYAIAGMFFAKSLLEDDLIDLDDMGKDA